MKIECKIFFDISNIKSSFETATQESMKPVRDAINMHSAIDKIKEVKNIFFFRK